MLKLTVGDIGMVAIALFATLLMILLGSGRSDASDVEHERRSDELFLARFTQHMSPVLVGALIVGLGGVAYVFIFAYYKAL